MDISTIANQKLEGWLDENTFEDKEINFSDPNNIYDDDDYAYTRDYNEPNVFDENEEDPWI